MKYFCAKLIKLLPVAILLCLMAGCNEKTCGDFTPEVYKLENQSGHVVSIVTEILGKVDSLVLLQNEIAIRGERYDEADRIYFDGRYLLKMSDLPMSMSPAKFDAYQYVASDNYYLFTFNEDDYLYAVEHGTDLEAGK